MGEIELDRSLQVKKFPEFRGTINMRVERSPMGF